MDPDNTTASTPPADLVTYHDDSPPADLDTGGGNWQTGTPNNYPTGGPPEGPSADTGNRWEYDSPRSAPNYQDRTPPEYLTGSGSGYTDFGQSSYPTWTNAGSNAWSTSAPSMYNLGGVEMWTADVGYTTPSAISDIAITQMQQLGPTVIAADQPSLARELRMGIMPDTEEGIVKGLLRDLASPDTTAEDVSLLQTYGFLGAPLDSIVANRVMMRAEGILPPDAPLAPNELVKAFTEEAQPTWYEKTMKALDIREGDDVIKYIGRLISPTSAGAGEIRRLDEALVFDDQTNVPGATFDRASRDGEQLTPPTKQEEQQEPVPATQYPGLKIDFPLAELARQPSATTTGTSDQETKTTPPQPEEAADTFFNDVKKLPTAAQAVVMRASDGTAGIRAVGNHLAQNPAVERATIKKWETVSKSLDYAELDKAKAEVIGLFGQPAENMLTLIGQREEAIQAATADVVLRQPNVVAELKTQFDGNELVTVTDAGLIRLKPDADPRSLTEQDKTQIVKDVTPLITAEVRKLYPGMARDQQALIIDAATGTIASSLNRDADTKRSWGVDALTGKTVHKTDDTAGLLWDPKVNAKPVPPATDPKDDPASWELYREELETYENRKAAYDRLGTRELRPSELTKIESELLLQQSTNSRRVDSQYNNAIRQFQSAEVVTKRPVVMETVRVSAGIPPDLVLSDGGQIAASPENIDKMSATLMTRDGIDPERADTTVKMKYRLLTQDILDQYNLSVRQFERATTVNDLATIGDTAIVNLAKLRRASAEFVFPNKPNMIGVGEDPKTGKLTWDLNSALPLIGLLTSLYAIFLQPERDKKARRSDLRFQNDLHRENERERMEYNREMAAQNQRYAMQQIHARGGYQSASSSQAAPVLSRPSSGGGGGGGGGSYANTNIQLGRP